MRVANKYKDILKGKGYKLFLRVNANLRAYKYGFSFIYFKCLSRKKRLFNTSECLHERGGKGKSTL